MLVKERVCVKNKQKTLFNINGFMNIKNVIELIKLKEIKEKLEVEYLMTFEPDEEIVIALYLIDEDYNTNAALFPYGSFQNKMK